MVYGIVEYADLSSTDLAGQSAVGSRQNAQQTRIYVKGDVEEQSWNTKSYR